MHKYSAEWIKEQAQLKGACRLDHHNCCICGVMVGYDIAGDLVQFDANCDCTTYYSPPRPSSFEDIADWLARCDFDVTRDRIMEGLR